MSIRTGVLPTVSELTLSTLPHHRDVNGGLVVMEALTHVPFSIARVFFVEAPNGAVRGQHAHKACAQFLTCPRGLVEVACDDGITTATYALDRPDRALLVPAGIWSEQTYKAPGSVLVVLCDRPYDADDYIREYGAFKAYRQAEHART